MIANDETVLLNSYLILCVERSDWIKAIINTWRLSLYQIYIDFIVFIIYIEWLLYLKIYYWM